MYDSGDLRKGLKIEIDNNPYIITHFEFVKPGKGKSLYKCKLKNMITGVKFDKTFRSGDKFKEASIEEVEMEYLYSEKNNYCFMNSSTYEQIFINAEHIGELKLLLKENTVCNVLIFRDNPIGISLPNFVKLKVIASEPWTKGDTAAGSSKPAKIETGYILNVPPFINEGELIKIDTRTGEYVERVK